MYGRSEAEVTLLYNSFDGNLGAQAIINTTASNFTSQHFYDRMEDGDYQLMVQLVPINGTFLMDHLECGCPGLPSQIKYANNLAASRIDNTSGNGFDLLTSGPGAQNVPAQAVIVDNTDSAIIYHNQSQWLVTNGVGVGDYGGSASYTSTPGASLSFSFDGVAIWYDCVSYDIQQPNVAQVLWSYVRILWVIQGID